MSETGSPEKTSYTVGSYLREIRESKGIGLDEAASVTRIGRNYLAAIEEEMFDKLPSTAYVKGFLRVYADYLGLSGDDVIGMFDKSGVSRQDQQSGDSNSDRPRLRTGKRIMLPGRWLVPLLLLIVVVVSAYFVGDNPAQRLDESGEIPTATTTGSKVAARPARVQPSISSATRNPQAVVAESDSRSSVPATADGAAKGGIILRLKVNQDSWLNITIDNAISQQYDLKAGDLIEWKGEKGFTLDIGNAGGIEGEFNGRPLKSFGEPGKRAHVVLSDQGI